MENAVVVLVAVVVVIFMHEIIHRQHQGNGTNSIGRYTPVLNLQVVPTSNKTDGKNDDISVMLEIRDVVQSSGNNIVNSNILVKLKQEDNREPDPSWQAVQPPPEEQCERVVWLTDNHVVLDPPGSGIWLDSGQNWTLAFAGRMKDRPSLENSILLGPGGDSGNIQIRYEAYRRTPAPPPSEEELDNSTSQLAIYTIPGPSHWEPILLPFPVTEFHVLALSYSTVSGTLVAYQNGIFVQQVHQNESFKLDFRRIGAWFTGRFQSCLIFHRVALWDTALDAAKVKRVSSSIFSTAGCR